MSWYTRAEDIKLLRLRLGTEWPSCVNCEYFAQGAEICTFKGNNQRPPARVIAYGCPEFDEIVPF